MLTTNKLQQINIENKKKQHTIIILIGFDGRRFTYIFYVVFYILIVFYVLFASAFSFCIQSFYKKNMFFSI